METNAVLCLLAVLFAWDLVEQAADRSSVIHMV